jgi:hypothetical protein
MASADRREQVVEILSRAVSLNPEALVPLQTPSHRCGNRFKPMGLGKQLVGAANRQRVTRKLDGVLTIPKIWLLLAFDVKLSVAQRGPRQLGIQRVLLCLSTASSITASRYVSRGIRGRLRQAHSTAESGRSSGNGPNASPIFSACPPPPHALEQLVVEALVGQENSACGLHSLDRDLDVSRRGKQQLLH